MADAHSELRVSDEDRERASREIREHFAAGRLTQEELDERLQAAYGARTQQELSAIRADLPRLPATPEQRRAELTERRAGLRRRLLQQSGGGLFLVALCIAIWLVSGANGQFWPVWVMLVVLIPLLRNGWRLYGPAPELERVERELARRERREDRHGARHDRRRHTSRP